jgi:hypothetical protein
MIEKLRSYGKQSIVKAKLVYRRVLGLETFLTAANQTCTLEVRASVSKGGSE